MSYVRTSGSPTQRTRTFYGDTQVTATLGAAADVNLPNVVLPNIAGTVKAVYVGVKFRMLDNTSAGSNGLTGAYNVRIKKSTGSWGTDDVAAINLVDNQWLIATATTREGGDVVIGDNDVAGEVDAFNATYNLRFEDTAVDGASLVLCDVQSFLVVTYEV